MSCSLLELYQPVRCHHSTGVFSTLPPLPTAIIPPPPPPPSYHHISPTLLLLLLLFSTGHKRHLLKWTNEINWNVLLVIVFHFMLKEMTAANGLYKTNEPVLIISKRHEEWPHTHTHQHARTESVTL